MQTLRLAAAYGLGKGSRAAAALIANIPADWACVSGHLLAPQAYLRDNKVIQYSDISIDHNGSMDIGCQTQDIRQLFGGKKKLHKLHFYNAHDNSHRDGPLTLLRKTIAAYVAEDYHGRLLFSGGSAEDPSSRAVFAIRSEGMNRVELRAIQGQKRELDSLIEQCESLGLNRVPAC